ncbi:MAG: hypothetical protein WC544_01595 [Patescibacteria group bacterium]
MKRIYILLVIAVLAILIGCAEKLPTSPTVPPLTLTAQAVPDSIPLSYALGLYMKPEGGVPPYVTEWRYGDVAVSTKAATTFKPDALGTYEFWAFVSDEAGAKESTTVTVRCIPLDSVPPDTVTIQLPPDTIKIQLPPDTVIQIIIRIDTVQVPHYIYDTTTVHDSVLIYVPVIDTLIDTLYLPIGVVQDTACWSIDWQNLWATVQLHNQAGWYRCVGFDRLRKDLKPYDKEFSISLGGQEFYFSVYGRRYLVEWVGDMGVYLEENATVIIQLKKPEYLGKVTGTLCQYYLEGCYWWLVPMDPPNS